MKREMFDKYKIFQVYLYLHFKIVLKYTFLSMQDLWSVEHPIYQFKFKFRLNYLRAFLHFLDRTWIYTEQIKLKIIIFLFFPMANFVHEVILLRYYLPSTILFSVYPNSKLFKTFQVFNNGKIYFLQKGNYILPKCYGSNYTTNTQFMQLSKIIETSND